MKDSLARLWASRGGKDAYAAYRNPRQIKATTGLRQVTSRTGLCNTISGSQINSGWSAWMFSHVPISAIQVAIWNGYVASGVETGSGGIMTCTLGLDYPLGSYTRLTWDAGASSKAIADNAIAYTDVVQLPFEIPAYKPFRIKGLNQFAGSGRVISRSFSNAIDRGRGDEFSGSTGAVADNTLNTTPYTGTGSSSQGFFPQLVLGYSNRKVIGGVGTSIVAGVEDRYQDPGGGIGLFGRSMARFGPYINAGSPGAQLTNDIGSAGANYAKRLAILQGGGMDAAFLEYGINDLWTGNRTAAQLLADRVTMRALLAVPVYDTTLLPNTASSDTYATAANQTAKAGNTTAAAARLTFNQAIRAGGLTGSSGYIDLAAPIETSTTSEQGPVQDGGVWLPRFMFGGDGIHPLTAALRAMEAPIDALLYTAS